MLYKVCQQISVMLVKLCTFIVGASEATWLVHAKQWTVYKSFHACADLDESDLVAQT